MGRSLSLPEVIVAGWLLSLFTMILWGLAGMWARFSLQRRGRPPAPALMRVFEDIAGPAGRGVRLIVSDVIDSPITWGALRPVILVPRKFDEASVDGELRWALAHEWSHVRQRDFATLCLATAVQFVYFYQPLYWVLRRRMILCQGYVADALAARHSDSAEDYAAFLVRLAKSRLQPAASLALGIVDYRSHLFQRVRMLVDPRAAIRPDCRKRFTVLTACGSLICLLLLTIPLMLVLVPRLSRLLTEVSLCGLAFAALTFPLLGLAVFTRLFGGRVLKRYIVAGFVLALVLKQFVGPLLALAMVMALGTGYLAWKRARRRMA